MGCSASNYDPCSSAGHHYHCSSSRDVCSVSGIHNGSSACDVRSVDLRSAGHHHCSTTCDLCSASNYELWHLRRCHRIEWWLLKHRLCWLWHLRWCGSACGLNSCSCPDDFLCRRCPGNLRLLQLWHLRCRHSGSCSLNSGSSPGDLWSGCGHGRRCDDVRSTDHLHHCTSSCDLCRASGCNVCSGSCSLNSRSCPGDLWSGHGHGRSCDVHSAGHHHHCISSCVLCRASGCDVCSGSCSLNSGSCPGDLWSGRGHGRSCDVRSAGHHHHCSSSCELCSLVGLDLNHNGRADVFVMGADRNLNGIIDVLEQGMGGHHKHHHHHDHHHHGHRAKHHHGH